MGFYWEEGIYYYWNESGFENMIIFMTERGDGRAAVVVGGVVGHAEP